MREAAGAYGEKDSYRSAADITGPESLAKVRAHKQEMKRAAKSGTGREKGSDPGHVEVDASAPRANYMK